MHQVRKNLLKMVTTNKLGSPYAIIDGVKKQ